MSEKQKINILDKFGINLNKKAIDGKIDKIIHRDDEINRTVQILSKRKKNNPIFIGHEGVGKSQLANSIADRIVKRQVPANMNNKIIYELDIAAIMAGTKYRGEMEERISEILKFTAAEKKYILFIDEIHTIMSSNTNLDIANIFKPYLSSGEVQCMGATTLNEYRKYFEKDAALTRRFQAVMLNPPTPEQTVDILLQTIDKYEEFHKIKYPTEILKKIPSLAYRYITNRYLPDSAFDIVDEVGAVLQLKSSEPNAEILELEKEKVELETEQLMLVKNQQWGDIGRMRLKIKENRENYNTKYADWLLNGNKNKLIVSDTDVLSVVANISGVPLDNLKLKGHDKIEELNNAFNKRIISQKSAKESILRVLKRNTVGVSNQDKPIAVFLFCGSTGVGKTEVAKVLSDVWFDGSLIRLDMSEYMEKISLTQLIGSPAGYVGYDDATKIDVIRNKPYSVVLLDEIEKAHPDILNAFLQVFDDGYLTNSKGDKLNFKNTIIIMTSNLGVKEVKIKSVGFRQDETIKEVKTLDAIKKHFTPELFNRIDEVVLFEDIKKEDCTPLLELEIEKISNLLSERNITLKVNDKLKKHLIDIGYSDEYGVRFLTRTVQKELLDALTEYLLEHSVIDNSTINCTLKDNKIYIKHELRNRTKNREKDREEILL